MADLYGGAPQRSIYVASVVADVDAACAQVGADPSLTNRRGGKRNWTPLLYLCCSRYRQTDPEASKARLRIATRLIELGADVNAAGLELGYTAPHVNQMFDEHEWRPIDGAAGRLANVELVRLLLDKGADLNITYETLLQAVRGANVDVLNLLLKAGPQDWWQVGWALKACAVLDRPDMARILMSHLRLPRIPETALLEAGALPDVRNFDLETPLDLAVAHVDVNARDELTWRLLKAGAHPLHDETRLDTEEMNLLFERAADAVVFGVLDTLRELLEDEPLLVHMRSPRPHRATLLHYCGANGTEDPRQRTPANAPAIARLLLDRGADVNATCNLYGGGATTMGLLLTSIHPLRAGLRTAMAETLLNAMATIDVVGAASLGRLDLVRKFVNPTRAEMQSAFMSACEFGRTAVVEFLLDKGANLHAQDGNGQSGLHSAALAGHADTVKLLLERHAPLEVQNVWGGTVLGNVLWAAINHDPNVDYVPIVNMLVEAKARVEPEFLTWWRQQSPLVASAKPRIEELLKLRL